jgi:hypothetical protein
MSENKNNEKEILATLSEGEIVIPNKEVEEIEEFIAEIKAAEAVEAKVEEKAVVIETPKPSEKPGLGPVGNGAMGSTTFKEEKKTAAPKKAVKKEETVAIHSTRNVTWAEVGKVYIGYNIVSKEAAEKWLTRDHTRLATPEEVAQEFGL